MTTELEDIRDAIHNTNELLKQYLPQLVDGFGEINQSMAQLQASLEANGVLLAQLVADMQPAVPYHAKLYLSNPTQPHQTEGTEVPITIDSVGEQLVLGVTDRDDDNIDIPSTWTPTFAVDDTTVATVTNGAPNIVDPGQPNADPPVPSTGNQVAVGPLTILKAGTINANVSVIDTATGNPPVDGNGNPIPAPPAVSITIDPGAPAGERMVVTP